MDSELTAKLRGIRDFGNQILAEIAKGINLAGASGIQATSDFKGAANGVISLSFSWARRAIDSTVMSSS